jgi:hypothetical protein
MRLWELTSVCRDERHLLERLGDRPEWTELLRWALDSDRLVAVEDREKLDRELPDEACRHVLRESQHRYYLSEGYVRIRPWGSVEAVLSAVDVLDRYGGHVLEDVHEYGLVKVQEPASPSARSHRAADGRTPTPKGSSSPPATRSSTAC